MCIIVTTNSNDINNKLTDCFHNHENYTMYDFFHLKIRVLERSLLTDPTIF